MCNYFSFLFFRKFQFFTGKIVGTGKLTESKKLRIRTNLKKNVGIRKKISEPGKRTPANQNSGFQIRKLGFLILICIN